VPQHNPGGRMKKELRKEMNPTLTMNL